MNEKVVIALLNNEFEGLKIRDVFKFLYSDREILRFKSAEVLGVLCKGKLAYNYLLRLFWHLSDESGAYCIGAPLAIAEIGLRNPEIFEGFRMKYLHLLENEEVERSYVAYGIFRNAETYRSPVVRDLLRKKFFEIEDPRFKAYSLLALAKMGEKLEIPNLKARIRFYDGREIVEIDFAELQSIVQHL